MKIFQNIALSLLLLAIIAVSVKIFDLESERRDLVTDRIELSKIKYGLFNVDNWKEILSGIIAKKVEELDLEGADRVEMEAKVTKLLNDLINTLESSYYEDRPKTLKGILQGAVANMTGMFEQMRKDIPKFVNQIMDFLNNPENRDNLRTFIVEKIEEYTDKTFSEVDYTELNQVLNKYKADTRESAIAAINIANDTLGGEMQPFRVTLFGIIAIALIFLIIPGKLTPFHYLCLTLIGVCLLALGVMLPMIDIDARISEMRFNLLGEPVAFKDQVLFYRSKSILEVTQLLLAQGKWDIILVGILIFAFSIFFPLLKLVTSLIYVFKKAWRKNKFLKFTVFKTGKWSMADVMVVAIFMAYIGFRGVISDQLNQLQGVVAQMEILTTNESRLQLGFFVFTAFVLLSLFIAQRLQNQFGDEV